MYHEEFSYSPFLEETKKGSNKMVVRDIPLLVVGMALFVTGTGLLIYWAYRDGVFNFLKATHYIALVMFILAGVLTWYGLVAGSAGSNNFTITGKQWGALVLSVLISALWWGRFVYSISPAIEAEEE
jgi:hypothetical protein